MCFFTFIIECQPSGHKVAQPAGLYWGVWGNVVGNPLVGAQNTALANSYIAKNGGFGIDDDVILNIGVAFYAFDGVAVFVQGETLCA